MPFWQSFGRRHRKKPGGACPPTPLPAAPSLVCLPVRSIQQAVELLLKDMPKTQVVVLGVLPRGTGSGKGQKLGQNDMSWPSHYTKATNDINKLLR